MQSPPPPELKISPPLLNSANPWCTTLDDLRQLHACPHTGALTTRTSLLAGFAHNDASHQYAFFDPSTAKPSAAPNSSTPEAPRSQLGPADVASLNNLGYSPLPLQTYLDFISQLPEGHGHHGHHHRKLIIISVTGTPSEIAQSYALIASFSSKTTHPLAMEINLSCPNIATAAPPASDRAQLLAYLAALPRDPLIPIGLKTPPYTHLAHYAELIAALREDSTVVTPKAMLKVPCKISFITAVNTLGSCLLLEGGDHNPRLPGSGLGGMAGAPLHPLALGNVKTIAELVAREPELLHIKVIGVGGVSDADAFRRMKSVGAYAVAVGTALGREGIEVFEKIAAGLEKH
ncbi:dihydroorotate dehydrogenase [Colletotrichum costaricense]|uniref:Dihydroorotate dehydrogenase (fumarate) n=2 Tax=Colletotrichum acutatum species complex TaxID=2707335 RepID=A0AAI9Z104_9PEZI|nr:dihydroorotate dehydrogenase [Colletotrichum costaricense]XP_060388253.1 dihydroorotate dehydrogenase [Colletotrichum tamarilloi]KAI3529331.1 dihydroorotate dehydrogenase [Colletotrichum filicis]KAK1511813.1 dihydroorotate dehydrogenase [Colletotrichum tamarilloi]KAK1530784.1 dihydroorotate dehydrogenase [Colletotrichum costaricense]